MKKEQSDREKGREGLWETVHRVCKRLGVSVDTVRHYREQGLLSPRRSEKGYHLYSLDDMLRILLYREMRSMELSLSEARDMFENRTIKDYNAWITKHGAALENRIRLLELELQRLRETQVYASCGERILNSVEEFDGPGTWAVGMMGVEDPYKRGEILARWMEHFPFTYVSVTIDLEELEAAAPGKPYPVMVGAGALEKYQDAFDLPLTADARYQPGGHFIRTCVKVRNILSLTPADLAPLYDYARAKKYRFVSCTGGRVLFMEEQGDGPVYYLLVWVRVEEAKGL